MKKYILYILILATLIGPFGSIFVNTVRAADNGACWQRGIIVILDPTSHNEATCLLNSGAVWQAPGAPLPPYPYGPYRPTVPPAPATATTTTTTQPAPATTTTQPKTSTTTQNGPLGKCILPNGSIESENVSFSSCPPPKLWVGNIGGTPIPIELQPTKSPDLKYYFLAPLPDPNNKGKLLVNFDPTNANGENSKIGEYLNMMIRIFIGLCAVLAVIMIVVGGIEYMTSELVSSKEAGRERITGAILGLLLALGSWTLLNQINPDILNTDLQSLTTQEVQVTITNFEVSGALSRNGIPTRVNFNAEAYPAANIASQKTGVDKTLILAIFAQESGGGANSGGCLANDPRARMSVPDKTALQTIVGGSIDNIYVSCAGTTGYGGAIGYTQFLPTTWLQYQAEATRLLGHTPDPWNTNDALMMTALKLKADGALTNPRQAACAYFGRCSSGGVNYADQIIQRMAIIQQQIATAKANGTIKP